MDRHLPLYLWNCGRDPVGGVRDPERPWSDLIASTVPSTVKAALTIITIGWAIQFGWAFEALTTTCPSTLIRAVTSIAFSRRLTDGATTRVIIAFTSFSNA